MPYLIDGNNLMGRRRTRIETLRMLADFAKALGAKVTVVFDGEPECNYPDGSVFRGVKIFYSRRGSNADARIRRMVADQRNKREFILVTSDRSLASEAASLGARHINVPEFLSIYDKAINKIGDKETDAKPVLRGELNDWLRYFGCEPQEADADEF
jgi:predicted RNA-binding protein with PIN domain